MLWPITPYPKAANQNPITLWGDNGKVMGSAGIDCTKYQTVAIFINRNQLTINRKPRITYEPMLCLVRVRNFNVKRLALSLLKITFLYVNSL